jgi:hypothetical protein
MRRIRCSFGVLEVEGESGELSGGRPTIVLPLMTGT